MKIFGNFADGFLPPILRRRWSTEIPASRMFSSRNKLKAAPKCICCNITYSNVGPLFRRTRRPSSCVFGVDEYAPISKMPAYDANQNFLKSRGFFDCTFRSGNDRILPSVCFSSPNNGAEHVTVWFCLFAFRYGIRPFGFSSSRMLGRT